MRRQSRLKRPTGAVNWDTPKVTAAPVSLRRPGGKTWRSESGQKHLDVREIFAEAFESIRERRMAKPGGRTTAEGFCVVRSLGVTLRNQLAYGSFHVELHDVRYLASSDVRYVDYILF
jgi:hypothetical protein